MELTIVEFNPDGDGMTALYIDKVLYTYGDYYHDKIDDFIRGFLEGIKYINNNVIKITIIYGVAISKELTKEVVDFGGGPPDNLSKFKIKVRKKKICGD